MKKDEIILDNIKSRRSVRKYTDQKISDDDLYKILEAGRWAPSGANAQPWQFLILRNSELIRKVGDACYYSILKSRHVAEANVVIVILGNPKAGSATYVQDCTIAGANMTLMANALGIGSCWIGAFENETIRELLKIPENLQIVALICFGYAAKKLRITPRLDLDDIVKFDKFDEFSSTSNSKFPKKDANAAFNMKNKILAAAKRKLRSGPLSVIRQIIGVLINRRS